MTLYEQWKQLGEMQKTSAEQHVFWNNYFADETDNYKKILQDTSRLYSGTVTALAEEFNMTPVVFTGFIDGINTSLETEINLYTLEENSEITLNIVWEKLYFNMLNAKAKWLYTLPEWDGVLTPEQRRAIAHEWRSSVCVQSDKTTGRNEPCPCGSGKKYKKCCGKEAI